MRLSRGLLDCTVLDCTEDEMDWLESYLTFEFSSFNGRTRRRYKDERQLIFGRPARFPSGWLAHLTIAAREDGMRVVLKDDRPNLPPILNRKSRDTVLADLWDFQREALEIALERRNGIVKAPTGSGKSFLLTYLPVITPSTRWILLVNNKDLQIDLTERWEDLHGITAANKIEDYQQSQVTVATFQGVYSALNNPAKNAATIKALDSFGGLIAEEAHTVKAKTFWRVARMVRHAHWRLGFSATPIPGDTKESVFTVACLGPLIYKISARTLIDRGIIAEPIIRMYVNHCDPLKVTGAQWQTVEKKGIVNNSQRNDLAMRMVFETDKPALVFCKYATHGKALVKEAEDYLYTAYVDGKTPDFQRQSTIADIERGDLDAVVTLRVWQQGVDIPSLASVVNIGGGKSIIAAVQKIGRGSRTAGGTKDTFQVRDIWDVGHPWLERHARARCKAYMDEGYAVTLVDPLTGAEHCVETIRGAMSWARGVSGGD